MNVDLSRGALRLNADTESEKTVPLTSPINDLIGLRADAEYAAHVAETYKGFWPDEWQQWFQYAPPPAQPFTIDAALDDGMDWLDILEHWRETLERNLLVTFGNWQHMSELFLDAAELAETGSYSAKLADSFELIKRQPGDTPDEIPDGDLPALAAWALDQALRLWPLKLVSCPGCHIPWLTAADQENPYCLRPAPYHSTSCRALARERQYRADTSPWRREYKRLHERARRGTLSEHDLTAWKTDNAAGVKGIDWQPYDEWQQAREASPDT